MHDRIAYCATSDQGGAHRQPVHEARARGVDIHRAGTMRTEQLLDTGGRVRHLVVASAGSQNDEVELLGGQSSTGERPGGSDVSEIRNPDVADRALPDSRSLDDPCVARVEQDR